MNQQHLITIANAKSAIDIIHQVHDRFLQNATSNAEPQSVPTKLEFVDEAILVDCFGHKAVAKARIIRSPSGSMWIEYRFVVAQPDSEVELWRFYLTSSGLITESTDESSKICDFDNRYIAKHICSRLLLNVLSSPLFAPTPLPGG